MLPSEIPKLWTEPTKITLDKYLLTVLVNSGEKGYSQFKNKVLRTKLHVSKSNVEIFMMRILLGQGILYRDSDKMSYEYFTIFSTKLPYTPHIMISEFWNFGYEIHMFLPYPEI